MWMTTKPMAEMVAEGMERKGQCLSGKGQALAHDGRKMNVC